MIEICSDFVDEWVKIGAPAKDKVIAEGIGGDDKHAQFEACARVRYIYIYNKPSTLYPLGINKINIDLHTCFNPGWINSIDLL